MPAGARFRFDIREVSGALGDLGTLLPLMLGAIAVAGLAPLPVLGGFALAYVATGLWYRLPVPVQPMKAVAAVLLTAEIAPESVAIAGVMIGLVLLVLGFTGLIDRLARLVPRSVLAGLQLGLGIGLALIALRLIGTAPVFGIVASAAVAAMLLASSLPAALLLLAVALPAGLAFGLPGITMAADADRVAGIAHLPTLSEMGSAFTLLTLPQLSLTLTNAVILTALVARDFFGDAAREVTPRRLSVSTGLLNLLLCPFGALPMCHGAGGLAAHYRFGARSGTAPVLLGAALVLLALLPGGLCLTLLSAIPAAALGALLIAAAAELALSRRLFDCKPSCWPVIAAAAAVTIWADPFWGLVAGSAAEVARKAVLARLRRAA